MEVLTNLLNQWVELKVPVISQMSGAQGIRKMNWNEDEIENEIEDEIEEKE